MSGYGYIPEDMFCRPDVKPGDFAVYAALEAHCTTERRHCWPGQDTLMRMTGLGVRALRDALGRLTLARFIRVERKSVGGLKRGNVYHLRPAPIAPSEDVTPEGKTGTDRTIDRHGSHHHTGTDRTVYSGADRTVEVSQREASHPKNTPPSPSAPAPGGGELDLGDKPVKKTRRATVNVPLVPPSHDEVMAYAVGWGATNSEADAAFDRLELVGWTYSQGKAHIKSWRAAVRDTIKRNRGWAKQANPNADQPSPYREV